MLLAAACVSLRAQAEVSSLRANRLKHDAELRTHRILKKCQRTRAEMIEALKTNLWRAQCTSLGRALSLTRVQEPDVPWRSFLASRNFFARGLLEPKVQVPGEAPNRKKLYSSW